MAVPKLHILFLVSLFLALTCTPSQADSAVEQQQQQVAEAFRIELDKLTARLHSLESVIAERNHDLKSKDETIAREEKKDSITSLPNEVHSAWLPPSLPAFLTGFQSYAESNWEKHGKPAFESLSEKTMEKKIQAEKWAEPHVQTIKTKWVPAAKEQWESVMTNAESQLQSLTKKTKEVYIQSKDTLTPHVIKFKEAVDPHIQSVKKVCSPYIDQIATATKPHSDKAPTCHCDQPHPDKAQETVI